MNARRKRGCKGYTLVELIVVMGMLGILAAMVVPLAEMNVQRDRERELKLSLQQIRQAIDEYHQAALVGQIAVPAGASAYPPSLQVLVDGIPDARVPGKVLYFLRKMPRDPFADSAAPAEATWQLRSYVSPSGRPQPGVDVYDVASRSDGMGMNGVPLRDW